jgi:hypothetical protein
MELGKCKFQMLVVMLATIAPLAAGQCRNSGASFGAWELVASNRCFGAGGADVGDDLYAPFTLFEPASAIKLVYLSGGVSCNFASRGVHSKWGCDPGPTADIGTFVTRIPQGAATADITFENIVAPPATRIDHDNLWWHAYDSNWAESDELTFADTAIWSNGQTNWVNDVTHSQEAFAAGNYGIWYGEDLHDGSEQDNHGMTCVDVYTLAVDQSKSECLSKDPNTMKKIEAHSIRGEVDPVTLANHAGSLHFACTCVLPQNTCAPEIFTVPSTGVYNVWLSGGGGGFGSLSHDPNVGGAAGFTWGTLDLKYGDQLEIYVGCAGVSGDRSGHTEGGGGGGGSAVLMDGDPLLVAGGAGA